MSIPRRAGKLIKRRRLPLWRRWSQAVRAQAGLPPDIAADGEVVNDPRRKRPSGRSGATGSGSRLTSSPSGAPKDQYFRSQSENKENYFSSGSIRSCALAKA